MIEVKFPDDGTIVVDGLDNYDRRQLYANAVWAMERADLKAEMKKIIWLSAWASNNPRSDYHWQVDLLHDVGKKRFGDQLYRKAHAEVVRENR